MTSLSAGASIRVRAVDIDYQRTAAYRNLVVIKAETATLLLDKSSGNQYLKLTFSRRFVATAWVVDVAYDVMRSGFSAFHESPEQSAATQTGASGGA